MHARTLSLSLWQGVTLWRSMIMPNDFID